MNWFYIILVILAIYLLFTSYVQKKISKARYLNEDRRNTHKKLIWYLPFLGPLLIKDYWQKQKKGLGVMTKEKRNKGKGGFHESGKGIFG